MRLPDSLQGHACNSFKNCEIKVIPFVSGGQKFNFIFLTTFVATPFLAYRQIIFSDHILPKCVRYNLDVPNQHLPQKAIARFYCSPQC